MSRRKSKTEVREENNAEGLGCEVLPLPRTHVKRSVVQLPPSCPLEGISRTAYSSINRTFIVSRILNGTSNQITLVTDPLSPNYATKRLLTEEELLISPRKNRLRFFYGLPGYGTSTLMVQAIFSLRTMQQGDPCKSTWISYMDLRRVCLSLQKKGLNETWTLAKMIAEYNHFENPAHTAEIEAYFKPLSPSSRNSDGDLPPAELFLDELDEIPVCTQEIILKILKKVDWSQSEIRVWLALRPHMKQRVDEIIKEDGNIITSFELLPLPRESQIQLWMDCWKLNHSNLCEGRTERIKTFASDLHNYMEQHIPNFFRTLGTCPSHLQRLAEYLSDSVQKYVNDPGNVARKSPIFDKADFSWVKIFEMLMRANFNSYLDQWIKEFPAANSRTPTEVSRARENEFRKLERLHVKFAIATYGSQYSSTSKIIFHKQSNQAQLEFQVLRVGIIYEINGRWQFLHQKYAEFLLAQYYADYGRLKSIGSYHMTFFLNKVLFDEGCKGTRKLFNDYWSLQEERKKIKQNTGWPRLYKFLSSHYCLNEEKNGKDGKGVSYEDIQDGGSVLHLCLIEKNLTIYEMIMQSFSEAHSELRKFLSITTPLEVFNDYPFSSNHNCIPETHTVTAFHLLALFATDQQTGLTERLVRNHLKLFEKTPELSKYFEKGTWNPLHYAGMSSNSDFLQGLLNPDKETIKGLKINVNLKNPHGKEASHLVFASRNWYFTMKILDRPHNTISFVASESSSGSSDSSPVPSTSNGFANKLLAKKKVSNNKRLKRLGNFKKTCKEIWSFEGTFKDFSEAWEHCFYPSRGDCGYLQPHFSVLDVLIGNGADVNSVQRGDGKTLLHLAATFSSPNLVKFLLRRGADQGITDNWGKTPAHYAQENGNWHVLMLLNGMEVD